MKMSKKFDVDIENMKKDFEKKLKEMSDAL